MGQKTNPISLQVGTKISWDTKFAEKKVRDTGVVSYNSYCIETFIKRFLEYRGFHLQKIKIYYQDNSLKIFLSLFSMVEKKKNLIPAYYKTIKKNGSSESFKSFFSEENENPLSSLVRLLNDAFLPSRRKVQLFVSVANKQLNTRNPGKKMLKKNLMLLRRFRRQEFFKEGVESVVAVAKNKNFSIILAKFLLKYLKKPQQINRISKFLRKFLKLLIKNPDYPLSGVKIRIKGRFNRAGRARNKLIIVGEVPCNTKDILISYNTGTTISKNGSLGIRVWAV